MNSAPIITVQGISKRFDDVLALEEISTQIRSGQITGLVGPDGAGKTTLIRLMTGLLTPTSGRILVMGLDTQTEHDAVSDIVGYMPQRFGLYEDLSILENMKLYAGLRGIVPEEQEAVFEKLLAFTRLRAFTERRAGRLSGGMKQKLGLACALMGKPQVLLLDEPGVGVDPLSRQDLWAIVEALVDEGITVVWATAYLEEAERCNSVLLFNDGKLVFDGHPGNLTQRIHGRSFLLRGDLENRRRILDRALDLPEIGDGVIQGDSLRLILRDGVDMAPFEDFAAQNHAVLEKVSPRFEDAFIDLLGGGPGGTSALAEKMDAIPRIEDSPVTCSHLTKKFGEFTATDDVSFRVRRGEIFGLIGPNGAGKSTTFKMLCGLLRPTSGKAQVTGLDLRTASSRAKMQLGYMAQKFSLYGLLSVHQNLEFFAGVYELEGNIKKRRVDEMIETLQLAPYLKRSPNELPLGFKQRLALACSLMHRPPVLFLDEPTSGVDPLTRREFWTHINGLVQRGVTVLVTTHFMDEAEYCDRVALMHQARVIALDSPDRLKDRVRDEDHPEPGMEYAFIRLIQAAEAENGGHP